MTHSEEVKAPPVWIRKDITLFTCPKSYITSDSETLVEEFFIRRRLGAIDFSELSAKQVEAFAILEKALTAEIKDAQEKRRSLI
jgi:hypothetical protein